MKLVRHNLYADSPGNAAASRGGDGKSSRRPAGQGAAALNPPFGLAANEAPSDQIGQEHGRIRRQSTIPPAHTAGGGSVPVRSGGGTVGFVIFSVSSSGRTVRFQRHPEGPFQELSVGGNFLPVSAWKPEVLEKILPVYFPKPEVFRNFLQVFLAKPEVSEEFLHVFW